ncbi:MAG: TPM domain-containing protein [Actinobacteria bacterium]|nr:TPM domain-containing protein [Actinomycetota bacterium]
MPWLRRAGLLVLGAAAVLVGFAPAASATDPLTLTSEVTDQAGVLSTAQLAQVQSAVDKLAADTEYQLYVVLLPDFSGQTAADWVTTTATRSGLGPQDFVLAFSTQAPYQYRLAPQSSGSITSSEVEAVAASVEDNLRAAKTSGDWASAAVTAATGLDAAATSTTTSTGTSSGMSLGTVLLIGFAVIAVIALIATARRRRTVAAGPALPGPDGTPQIVDPFADVPTAELDRRSSAALVRLDDALRGSEQELGFAQAQFGEDSTSQFAEVLARGKTRVTEAFRLRQTLDDDVPDTEPQVRATAAQILALCTQTAEELDGQKAAFDQLRSVQDRVGDALDAHERSVATQRARIEPARATVTTLAARFPATSLTSVVDNADQAQRLLADVETTIAHGRAAVAAGDKAEAVGFAKAAEGALAQVDRLLDAIDVAGDELATIGPRLQAAVASISADLADAARLAPQDVDVQARSQEARDAITVAQAAAAGSGDPLAALSRITVAEAAIDGALAPLRERDEQHGRTRALVDQTLGRVASAVRATNDYIETRRGAVGPQARTRLAEADRLARQADARKGAEPDAALAEAQQAEQLVGEAQQLAQLDVEHDEQNRRGPGGFGGSGGGNNLGGMVLGGLLLGELLGGGHGGGGDGGGFGGGWGGGGDLGGGGGFGDGGFGGGF